MKRYISFVLIIFLLFTVSPPVFAEKETQEQSSDSSFVFSNSLKIVEEEAFAGTAVKTVVFHSGLSQIKENAFRGARRLTSIYIPSTVNYMAETALPLNAKLTICGEKGSYVQTWAFARRISFSVSENQKLYKNNHGNIIKELWGRCYVHLAFRVKYKRYSTVIDGERSMRPQDRPELYPIDYRFP